MNDERLGRAAGQWLRDFDSPPTDPQTSVQRAMEQVQATDQVHRWLPFRLFRPKAQTPTATNTTDYQPSPIPATNGHTPTVIGRTSSMLSPVKAITAGALVFAIGGVMLIAQPFDQQGSPPGAETAELTEPVEFTAVFTPSSQVRIGTTESVDGLIQRRGDAWTPIMSGVSDPRVDGTLTYSEDYDRYPGGHHFATVTYRIVNDGGAWQGSLPVFKENGSYDANSVVLLAGEGSYDGLYAWMDTSDWDAIQGVIFPAAPPEAPIPPELP